MSYHVAHHILRTQSYDDVSDAASIRSVGSLASIVSNVSIRVPRQFKKVIGSIRTPFRKNITDLYLQVKRWERKASPFDTVTFKLNDYEDSNGEITALMFHMNMNMNMRYGYEVIYAKTSNVMIVKKLGAVKVCTLPEMRVVGQTQIM